jgi:hypothetical protein
MSAVAPGLHELPAAGPAREFLREKGQFWTPSWVAEAMVAYAVGEGGRELFDTAVGEGAFLAAARKIALEHGCCVDLYGFEIDATALEKVHKNGLPNEDLRNIQVRDFIHAPPERRFSAIVANPPYIRHHRLSAATKLHLQGLGRRLLGRAVDARAGLHVYFLLQSLTLLKEHGRLAFLVPADTCEGVFSASVWEWITRHYRLDGVVTFEARATPFPGVDTNPVIFLLRKDSPVPRFPWLRVRKPDGQALRLALKDFRCETDAIEIHDRALEEGLRTGFSRLPCLSDEGGRPLADYATVKRGIATGANDFFFLTRQRASELGIPPAFLIPAIGRTRDVAGDSVTVSDLRRLEEKGRPTLLLSLSGAPDETLPSAVLDYLQQGMHAGLHERPLIATRRPWYRMEKRLPPPFLFAYLGRRNTRFLRNLAGVVPLSGFLCVYPRQNDEAFIARLWEALNHPKTIANLAKVGKSYGGGAIKVEPRNLERLVIPAEVLQKTDLGASPCLVLSAQAAFF